jgi:hypothetical protein
MTLPTVDVTVLAYAEDGLDHNISAWLPHARKVVVVVGGTQIVQSMGLPPVDAATLDAIRRVNDPHKQVVVITRDDYWKDKNEMILATREELKADLVWQVDADEFYLDEDIARVRHDLGLSDWVLAGLPHLIFWVDLSRVLVTSGGDTGWFAPSRIWRRRDGELFLHLPFSRIRRADGTEIEEHHRTVFRWGRCFHSSWCGPAKRLAFKFDFHRARGDGPKQAWFDTVWRTGVVPPHGVHPSQHGIFPKAYTGRLPPALVAAVGVT